MRRCRLFPALWVRVLCLLGWLLPLAATLGAGRPNILLLIADDYGVDASSLYNSTNTGARLPQTPHIASLATNGVVFRNAYANPLCSPTRACLLTGRHGFRTGVGDVVLGPMGAQGPLPASEFTLPRAFAQGGLGYQTAQFGKWHLANGTNAPLAVGGWTHYVGNLIGQITNYFLWAKTSNSVQRASTNYATTDLVNDAIAWIQARGTNAWLVWASFNAPHSPYHLPPTNLCPRQASLPGTPADISANPLNYYHAMVEALDTEIGRLLAALPDRANTHIVFLGDNGSASPVVQPPYAAGRAKGTLYEGGVRVPLIISGPAVVRPNRTNDTPAHATDLFPTLLELAGGNPASVVPTNVVIDGRSLLGALQTTNVLERRAYSELFGSALSTNVSGQALRDDRYKLIRFTSGQQRFHDLQADPAEQVNLLAGSLSAAQQAAYYRLAFALYGYTTNQGPAIAGSAWSNGMFSLRVGPAAAYTLWRSAEPSAGDWAPVTNAMALTNGGVVMVTDPAPPAGRALYKVVR